MCVPSPSASLPTRQNIGNFTVEPSFDKFQAAFRDGYEVTRDEIQDRLDESSRAVQAAADSDRAAAEAETRKAKQAAEAAGAKKAAEAAGAKKEDGAAAGGDNKRSS